MIAHQTKRMHLPIGLAAGLLKRFQKALTVGIVAEDWFAPVPTVHDVVHGRGVLNPKFARHAVRQNPVRQIRSQAPIDE